MGRIATAVMVLIALAWIPVVQKAHEPLRIPAGGAGLPGAADLRGLLLRRVLQTPQRQGLPGAMVVGFLAGDLPHGRGHAGDARVEVVPRRVRDGYAPGSFLWIVNNINFQYFSVLITLVSAVVMVLVSYLTKSPDYAKIGGLTFGTATAEDRRKTRASWDWRDVAASLVIVACIVGAYVYFTG